MNLSHAVAVVLAQLFELRVDSVSMRGRERSVVEVDGEGLSPQLALCMCFLSTCLQVCCLQLSTF